MGRLSLLAMRYHLPTDKGNYHKVFKIACLSQIN